MKRMLILAVAIVAMVFTTTNDASAQSHFGGFGFGVGLGQSFNGGFGGGSRFTAPPYFAQFPPVYYNGIVRRPYGISPFAAPAGITPVESGIVAEIPQPRTIHNPFINQGHPVAAPQKKPVYMKKAEVKEMKNHTTWIKNPFFVPEVEAIAEVKIDAEAEAILLASIDVAGATLIDLAEMATFKFN